MERTNCDFIMHDLWTLIWCGTQKYWKRKKAWLLQWTPPSFVGSDCLSQRFCGDCLTIILFSFMMTQGVLSWGSQWICYNLAVDDTCQRLLPSWPQASWLGTLLSYDSHNTTTLVTSHCPGPEGHLNEGVGGIWLGKWLKRSLCCNFPHCSRKLKPEQGMLKKPVLHLWEMKWKVPSLLLRVKSCVLESCSYFRWGERPQSMESQKKCNLFAVKWLSWTVLKCWSRWVLKQWVFWHFHTVGSEELGYLGRHMYFYLPRCQLFYNKFVLQSKVACVLLCKGYHLHIIHSTGIYRTFSGCGIL